MKEKKNKDPKTKIILMGTIIGALAGAGAAYLLSQNLEEEEFSLAPTDGVKLGVAAFSFLRKMTDLGK
ncbi:MAG: hypothetical protein MAG431_02023 [Chloroflexi bacterium]|nr:hypothetical protein [Chloroflexota bacterium]